MQLDIFKQYNQKINVVCILKSINHIFTFEYPFINDPKILAIELAKVVKSKGMNGLMKTMVGTTKQYNGEYSTNTLSSNVPLADTYNALKYTFICNEQDIGVYYPQDKQVFKPRIGVRSNFMSINEYVLDFKIDTQNLTELTVFSFDEHNKTY